MFPFLKQILPKNIVSLIINYRRLYRHNIYNILYSQSGEDGILKGIFFEKLSHNQIGFYIDVGCYNPQYLSNTCYLYYRGWNGINIDPNSESIKSFDKFRKRDKNINVGIWPEEKKLHFNFNTDNPEMSYISENKNTKNSKMIDCLPLGKLLDNLKIEKPIDYLNIDVEGNDLSVLESNNWLKYRPKVISIESLDVSINDIETLPLYQYLINKKYIFLTYTILKPKAYTLFFIERDIYASF